MMRWEDFALSTCPHCLKGLPIRSHIVPRSVGAWIKQTSISGYLSSGINPNKREQDIIKVKMLCKDCDGSFSGYEDKFLQSFFRPYQVGRRDFDYYGDWLYKFIAFTLLKIVYFEKYFKPMMHEPSLVDEIQLDYLINEIRAAIERDHIVDFRIAFLKDLESTKLYHRLKSGIVIREKYLTGSRHHYMMRAVDFGMPIIRDNSIVFFQIPGMTIYWAYQSSHFIHHGIRVNPYGGRIIADNTSSMSSDLLKVIEYFSEEHINHININMHPKRKQKIEKIRIANAQLLQGS